MKEFKIDDDLQRIIDRLNKDADKRKEIAAKRIRQHFYDPEHFVMPEYIDPVPLDALPYEPSGYMAEGDEWLDVLTHTGKKYSKDVKAELRRMQKVIMENEKERDRTYSIYDKQRCQDIINWIHELILYRALMNDMFDEDDLENETPMSMMAFRMGLKEKLREKGKVTYTMNAPERMVTKILKLK